MLLSALKVTDSAGGSGWPVKCSLNFNLAGKKLLGVCDTEGWVEFTWDGKTEKDCPSQYRIASAFYEKLNELVSKAEGKKVNILASDKKPLGLGRARQWLHTKVSSSP